MENRQGFTLFEISIVLAIVALIIGGIVVGRDMLRNAQINSVVKESSQFIQAIKNFQDKYRSLPGDFPTASSVWNTTVNGDGNGYIITQGTPATYYEQFTAWQQLSLANMIEGFYTGNDGGAGTTQNRTPGTNVPASQLQNAGWGLVSLTVDDINNNRCANIPYFTGDVPPNHVLWLGGASVSPFTCNVQAPALTAQEALILDKKIDDGLPGTGKIVVQSNGGGTECRSDGATYNISAAGLICALVFKTGF